MNNITKLVTLLTLLSGASCSSVTPSKDYSSCYGYYSEDEAEACVGRVDRLRQAYAGLTPQQRYEAIERSKRRIHELEMQKLQTLNSMFSPTINGINNIYKEPAAQKIIIEHR